MPAPDPDLLFPNAPLESLGTTLSHLALRRGLALKFPRDITPFAALLPVKEQDSLSAMADLHSLLEPGESTYIVSTQAPPAVSGITIGRAYPVRQFEWPSDAPLPPMCDSLSLKPLTCADAAEMVALTDIAFPGFFRIRTCEMGPYFGIRSNGRLVAMCGERLNIHRSEAGFPPVEFKEISGLCTRPDHRGRGYAAALLAHALHRHHEAGQRSYLHVASNNTTAIALYQRLGFLLRGEFHLHSIRRTA